MAQRGIPCLFMRGGTSRGPFFLRESLPNDPQLRDRVLLAAMGSPDTRQIDGLGGADTLTSKVAIVSPSERPGIDVDFLFAQVSIDAAIVDTEPSCGNMLAAVGPFAIERGLVRARADETRVMVFNINTGSRVEAVVRTPRGVITYQGGQSIDGVPGTAAPITLNFMDIVGSKCGALLPTGELQEEIDGIAVTCVDVAMPMVLLPGSELGLSGYETDAIANDGTLMERLERIRLEAGRRMGLGDVTGKVIPKPAILAPARTDGLITSRYFTPHRLHAAHSVTGAICVASAALMEGTVASSLATPDGTDPTAVRIEHPSGRIDVRLETSGDGANLRVLSAGVVRTARKIMDGTLYVPASTWPSPE